MRSVLGTLKDNLRVTRLGRSYIEQIAYTSLDPDKAAKIANAFAEAYIEDQLQAKFEATRRASVWLEQRIGELRQQASDAYKEVQDFKSQNSIIIGVDGKLASEVELDQLGIALAKARADTSQARAKLDRITRVLEQRPDQQGKLRHSRPSRHRRAQQSRNHQASAAISRRPEQGIGVERPLRRGSSGRQKPAG